MTNITAVIFDFGNVICSFDVRVFLARALPYSSLSMDDLQYALQQSHSTMREYETGLITSDEFFRRICTACRLSVSREDFITAYTQIFTPIPSTCALIRELRPHYKLGLLSNTNEWHFEFGIRPVEVFPLFDTVTLSYEVKAMKPSPEIYHDALHKLGVAPGACIYIDDLEENVVAARELGMHSVHFTSGDELRNALVQLGIRLT
jgi:epoxide hydrolase-like predicted phosphatase